MLKSWIIILIHQIVFQGMFVTKNTILGKKTGKQIRGKNKEATDLIIFFTIYVVVSLVFSILEIPIGEIKILSNFTTMTLGIVLLIVNLVISLFSMINLKDSWRVGTVEDQKTELVSSGIYKLTRNPYFLSHLIMFAAYTIILQNVILLVLSIIGFFFIHKMVLKEETHLYSIHGNAYEQYKKKVPRYIII
jgi:protein-S-isoprenylcysteine O-methyltransferase Ste14